MGRPPVDIDPLKVHELAKAGCKINEIAKHFGVTSETISERFSIEIRKGKHELDLSLRRAQIMAAKMGNATMLIWLGKQYLGQSDATIDDYLIEAIESAGLTKEDLLELIKRKDELQLAAPKKSFSEFCATAGYPIPFPKQEDMAQFAMRETATRLLLGARGYGKTDYITILGVAFEIYLNPGESSTLIITKSKERNSAIVGEIQSACMKNGVVFDRANSVSLRARGLHGKDNSVSAVTIKTKSLRGRHPERVIMDDPVTEDDVSEATRKHVERVYNEVMKLTMNVLIIGQPAHQADLYAKLRGVVRTMEVPHGTIPELDADLEAQRIAGVSEASISASYLLKVLSEGTTPFNAVKYLDRLPDGETVAFIDPSEGGDYTSVTILRGHMDGVAAVGFVWKRAWNHCLDEMYKRFQQFRTMRVAFETNHTGNQPIELLQSLWPQLGVVGRRTTSNKHARIMAAGHFAHLIHLSKQSDKTYLDHVTQYEYRSKYDDAPDSLASCMSWLGFVREK